MALYCSSLTQKLLIDKKVGEQEKKKDINKWSNLPEEILELIMERLCLRDYLALQLVCSPWRNTVTNAIANKHCCPLPELPLIFLRSKERVIISSLRTERDHCLKMSIFESRNTTCHGSVKGWLIMSDYVEKDRLSVFFFNPVANRRVRVPSPLYFPSSSPIHDANLFILNLVASSGPDCCKSDCYLVGLFNDYCHIAFYRLFDDKSSWNTIKPDQDSGIHFLDMEIKASKLYVRTDKDGHSILIYDLKDESPKPKVSVLIPEISTPHVSRIIDNQCHDSGYPFCCLAKHESLEELFLIYMICNVIYKPEHADNRIMKIVKDFTTPPEITALEVFKLDLNKEPLEWAKCQSLDDNVIFVSGFKSMVMSRAVFSSTDQGSIRKNSVYFAVSFECSADPWKAVLLGVKHLTDAGIKYFPVEKSNHFKVPYPFWFVPSI